MPVKYSFIMRNPNDLKDNITKLKPRVPDNFFTKNGYEDNNTNRVSFAPSIDKCLAGLSQNLDGKNLQYIRQMMLKNIKFLSQIKKQFLTLPLQTSFGYASPFH